MGNGLIDLAAAYLLPWLLGKGSYGSIEASCHVAFALRN